MSTKPRCDWCGVFIRKDTPTIMFLNIYGDEIQGRWCDSCADSVNDLAFRNIAVWPHGRA